MFELHIAKGTAQTQNYFCLDYQSERGYTVLFFHHSVLVDLNVSMMMH